MIIVLLLKMAY